MNDRVDIDLVLDRWVRDGPSKMPDRVAIVVADRIDRQKQRRAWRLPGRPLDMNPYVKIGAAVAALVLVVALGSRLLPTAPSGIGVPPATPSPTATPSATPSPTPSRLTYGWPRTLEAGTYTTRFTWDLPFQLRFTVPDGWESRDVEVFHGDLVMAVSLVGNVYSDPCRKVLMDPPIGPTVDDLANALAAIPGFDTTAPTAVAVEGFASGKYLELTVRDDAGCTMPGLWVDPPGSYNDDPWPKGPPEWGAEQPNSRIWILDIDGVRLVVSALWPDAATPSDLAELQAVVDSIRIVRPTGTPAPLPTP